MRLAIYITAALFTVPALAELTIFDVQRNLPLASGEKVFHDYYVDGGRASGLKTGMLLTVTRRLPMFDFYRGRSVGDLETRIAKVKVIDVQDQLAVVRLREEISREESPLSDDLFIMIGDHLDVTPAVAEVEVPAPTLAVAPPVAAVIETKTTAPAAGQIKVNAVTLSADEAKIAEPVPAPGAASHPQ